MAAQLKDGGRYPATHKLDPQAYQRFVQACENPPAPSEELKALMFRAGQRKAGCR